MKLKNLAICALFSVLFTSTGICGTTKQTTLVTKDSQAIAVVQTALTAMAETTAVGYTDSVSQGTYTYAANGKSVSCSITLKSKGTQETRVEVLMPKGTNIRIINAGQGVIEKPDGSVRWLLMNNTLIERVNHIPSLSLLSAVLDPSVSVEYVGTAQVNSYSTNVVALRPLVDPSVTQAQWDASLSKTIFYVDQVSGMVVKEAYSNFAENDSNLSDSIETYFSKYESVGGALIPLEQTTYVNGTFDSDLILSSVAFNQGLSDSEFALPAKSVAIRRAH